MKAVFAGWTILLAACSGSGAAGRTADEAAGERAAGERAAGERAAGERVANETPFPPAPPTPPRPDPATAIHVSEKTDRIEYELTIPAEAAALPSLKARLTKDAREARASTLAQQADYAREFPDADNRTFGVQHNWRAVGGTDRLLSLVLDVASYTGGAHGSAGTVPLLWDRQVDGEVPLAALFTSKDKALATLRPQYCRALDKAREEKSGTPVVRDGTPFTDCPPFSDLTIVPAGNVGGKFSRILIIADPYVAGSWAEGDYKIELPIPKAMVPFIRPERKLSFPG